MNINEDFKQIIDKRKGSKFDVVVMYTGGKDSSFLIYLLKEVYKLRILAVTVDNGYEFETSHLRMKEYLDNICVPLVVIKADKVFFTKLYRELIINPRNLRDGKRNYICHICNNLIWLNVCKYASDNEIPFVASGLSLEQLNSGRAYPLTINSMANRIAEKSTKMINAKAMEYLFENEELKKEALFVKLQEYIDQKNKYNITTIYPYIYHNVSVDEQKKTIREYGAWEPPIDIPVGKYFSSGCEIMNKVIFELEKLELIVLNEREEAKQMIKAGLLNADNANWANHNVLKEKVDLSDELFNELGVKDYLLNIASKRNQL